jgi:glycosyltransferase involved in cell wall biosynthesis
MRCNQPAEYLRSVGYDVEVVNIREAKPIKNGVIFFHRTPTNSFTRAFVKYAINRNNFLVYDTDDLTIDSSKAHTHMINRCDAVSVSTNFLSGEFQRYHNRVRVIRNALGRNFLELAARIKSARETRTDDRVTLAYLSGSATHDKDLELIEPVLLDLMRSHPNLQLILGGKISHSAQFNQFGQRFRSVGFMDYLDYLELYRQIDINLAPLDRNDVFNEGRSELKYMEAGACGIPTVASPTGSYRYAITDGDNGFLADDQDWGVVLNRLISDPELRNRVGEAAFQDIFNQYTPEHRAKAYHQLINDLLSSRASRNNPLRAFYYATLSNLLKNNK